MPNVFAFVVRFPVVNVSLIVCAWENTGCKHPLPNVFLALPIYYTLWLQIVMAGVFTNEISSALQPHHSLGCNSGRIPPEIGNLVNLDRLST
jgi:hypothetical protein